MSKTLRRIIIINRQLFIFSRDTRSVVSGEAGSRNSSRNRIHGHDRGFCVCAPFVLPGGSTTDHL